MIKVFFGLDKNSLVDVDMYFNNVYEYAWLEDELVKNIVHDIDDSDVVSPYLVNSKYLGSIPVTDISGGAKALILLLKGEDIPVIDLVCCGENCEKWLSRISNMKDIRVSLSGYDLLFYDDSIYGVCENDNSIINTSEDWRKKMSFFVERGKR